LATSSPGRARLRTGISREGSVESRRAIVDLGRGIGLHHPDFITCRRQLVARSKPPLAALIRVGHRAHRLAVTGRRKFTDDGSKPPYRNYFPR
jgi:hypothetical protein